MCQGHDDFLALVEPQLEDLEAAYQQLELCSQEYTQQMGACSSPPEDNFLHKELMMLMVEDKQKLLNTISGLLTFKKDMLV